jgi:Nucleotidyl transferase AbiEii toxin, Type IV TA system
MNVQPDRNTIDEVSLELGVDPAFIEKDWHVTQVIANVANMQHENFELVFTGGTALSKAHKLIKRFSEDIDFRVIVPEKENNRKTRSAFKKHLTAYLQNLGHQIGADQIHARDENRYFSIKIQYNKIYDVPSAIRSNILIEAYVRSPQMKPIYKPVSSLVNELYKQPPEVQSIACCNPIENAADKLSAVTWRIPDRKRGTNTDDRSIVRHIHDLAMLKEIVMHNKEFTELVLNSMKEDESRPKDNTSPIISSIKERFDRMLKILDEDKLYSKEYDNFVKSMSYAQNDSILSYEESVRYLKQLIAQVVG